MSKTTIFMAVAAIIGFAGVTTTISAKAADANIPTGRRAMSGTHCQDLWRCGPGGCNWHRVCTPPCPDGSSCMPLYGAYGPYGGVGYWGAYSDAGWAYQR